jgi:hypothetical protein
LQATLPEYRYTDQHTEKLKSEDRKMKKFAAFVILCITIFSAPLFAMDYIIGARGGYFVWDSFLKDIGPEQFKDLNPGDGTLYGPILSLLFTPDLSFSVAGLVGAQKAEDTVYDKPMGGGKRTVIFTLNTDRIDVDSAFNYRLGESFRVFLGYKLNYLNSVYSGIEITTTIADSFQEVHVTELDISEFLHGPAMGMGYSLMLGKGYFISANLSFLYMIGTMKFNPEKNYSYTTGVRSGSADDSFTEDLRLLGINFEPAIGVSFGEGTPIVTLGFRYQWNQLQFLNLSDFARNNMGITTGWMDDRLYGVFISVMYTI